MIIKDEKAVIERALESVKPLIEYWVIVDTGSTDGTQDIVREFMKDIPGELIERPWKNFGHNRTEALHLAKGKGDYLLILDADEWVEVEGELPELNKGLYYVWRGNTSFHYKSAQIVNNHLPWRWEGVVHEYLACDLPYISGTLENVHYILGNGGARENEEGKFLKYVDMLTAELEKNSTNTRNTFYLAESYRFAGKAKEASLWYQRRIDLGGWQEEVYWSQLQIAHLKKALGGTLDEIISAYQKAHRIRPHRSEAVYYLAEVYNQNGENTLAYELLKGFSFVPQPPSKDMLFNEDWIADYGLLFQYSIASYYVGLFKDSLEASDTLLKNSNLPPNWLEQAKINRQYALNP